jgi:hypothetical protein
MIRGHRPNDVDALAELYERSFATLSFLPMLHTLEKHRAWLWTFQQNDGARRFYERHGLRLIRLTDGEDNEEKTPDALYAWRRGGHQA